MTQYRVGDKVIIRNPHNGAYPGSPIVILDGTVAYIKEVVQRPTTHYYRLKFDEIHCSDINLFYLDMENCAWQDQHLEAVTDFTDDDLMTILGGDEQ